MLMQWQKQSTWWFVDEKLVKAVPEWILQISTLHYKWTLLICFRACSHVVTAPFTAIHNNNKETTDFFVFAIAPQYQLNKLIWMRSDVVKLVLINLISILTAFSRTYNFYNHKGHEQWTLSDTYSCWQIAYEYASYTRYKLLILCCCLSYV